MLNTLDMIALITAGSAFIAAMFAPIRPGPPACACSICRVLQRAAWLAAFLGLLICGGTTLPGRAPSTVAGSSLVLHCLGGGVFAGGIAAVAVLCTRRYFASPLYWLMLLASLVVMLPATLSMTALFDTDQQVLLTQTHRSSALALVIISAAFLGRRLAKRQRSAIDQSETQPAAIQ